MLCKGFVLHAFIALVQAIIHPHYHPCDSKQPELNKIQACATSASYCSSVLGGPASITRTNLYTTLVAQTTITVTTAAVETAYSTTITTTAHVVSTLTQGSTSTVFTYAPSCPSSGSDNNQKRGELPGNQCGLRRDISVKRAIAACNCIFGPSTIKTITKTAGGAGTSTVTATTTTTTTLDDTTTVGTTTTLTDTVAAPTATACSSLFYILSLGPYADGDYLQESYSGGLPLMVFNDDGNAALSNNAQSAGETFYVDPSTEYITHNNTQMVLGSSLLESNFGAVTLINSINYSDEVTPLECQIVSSGTQISCMNYYYSAGDFSVDPNGFVLYFQAGVFLPEISLYVQPVSPI